MCYEKSYCFLHSRDHTTKARPKIDTVTAVCIYVFTDCSSYHDCSTHIKMYLIVVFLELLNLRSVDPWKLCVGVKYYIIRTAYVQYAILHLW